LVVPVKPYKGRAVKQQARCDSAQHEILQTGFRGAVVVALNGRHHIKRQGLHLETDIQADQIVGRNHQQHAECRKNDQDRIFETGDVMPLHEIARNQDTQCRSDQDQRLAEYREHVGHEHIGKRHHPRSGNRNQQAYGQQQRDNRQHGDNAECSLVIVVKAAFLEHAEHQKQHDHTGQKQLRQGGNDIGHFGHWHRLSPLSSGKLEHTALSQ
jgi:hypothetical protein